MRKMILSLGFLAFLAGCQSVPTTIYVPATKTAVIEPKTQAVNLKGVKWQVITKVQLQSMLDDLNAHPNDKFVVMAVTPDGYKTLNSNLLELRRFISEQNQVIMYYRKYNADSEPVAKK